MNWPCCDTDSVHQRAGEQRKSHTEYHCKIGEEISLIEQIYNLYAK